MTPDLHLILYSAALGLIVIGVFGLIQTQNLVRMVLALVLVETGANLLLVMSGYRGGAEAPMAVNGVIPESMVDPIPQALTLTAIVIGVGIQAFAMTLIMRLQSLYGTQHLGELRQRMERDIESTAEIPPEGSAGDPGFRHPAIVTTRKPALPRTRENS